MIRRILLVEDEEALASVVALGLAESGYVVDVAFNGIEGLQYAQERNYSVLLLDLMLPGIGGREVCRQLRERGDRTPILMLTALSEETDRVVGLDAGADDYLTKPFEFEELRARIRSLVRRDRVYRTGTVRVADMEIDLVTRRVRRRNGEILLANREFSLLAALASREGQILTCDFLHSLVWPGEARDPEIPRVYISKLRKKVDAGCRPKLIHTVRGTGYVLQSEEPAEAL